MKFFMDNKTPQRVIAYIDGFNLYFGLRDSGFRRFYWLNIQTLAQNLLRKHQRLVNTKYFTARISGPNFGDSSPLAQKMRSRQQRQKVFLEALETLADSKTYYGHYLGQKVKCRNCGRVWSDYEEKMTDVNIATEMITDAFEDKYDTVLLISADSDLVPPVRAIRRFFSQKRIIVVFPPGRSSIHLKEAAHAQLAIWRSTLAKSQFPDEVTKADGYVLQRPEQWK